ncbi:hypothetical protein PHJA_001077400 [Phtheirospermum japonicum]|uniref:Uncharacterized protein n=1 Tax=Phtheirospermum japonicum TaxID=374723 RepID=A0A830BNZ2_9LAMI|nr:hypothetical protein PHJA_001077400 [Phtheirospermum japonicum]
MPLVLRKPPPLLRPHNGGSPMHGMMDNHLNTVSTLSKTLEEYNTEFPAPSLRRHDGETELIYLPMGSYLSLLISRSMFSWEFWEMKPETGEWTKMPNIDLEAQFAGSKNCILTPVGWLRSRESGQMTTLVIHWLRPMSMVAFHALTDDIILWNFSLYVAISNVLEIGPVNESLSSSVHGSTGRAGSTAGPTMFTEKLLDLPLPRIPSRSGLGGATQPRTPE